MQIIKINNIRIFGHHGVYEKEKIDGQYFYVNIIYSYDYSYDNDKIDSVINYMDIINHLHDIFDDTRFNLIEKLIDSLTHDLKTKFGFNYLKLSISKKIEIRDNEINITIEKEIPND